MLAPGGSFEHVGTGGAPALAEELPTLSGLVVRAGIASWSLVGILLLVAVAGFALRQVEPIFPPIIIGGIVVLLLEPFVSRLVARGVRRGMAVAIVYVAMLVVIAGLGFVAVPAMVHQGQQFSKDLPQLLSHGGSLASKALHRLNEGEAGKRLKDAVSSYLGTNAASLPRQVSRFASIGLRLANVAVNTVIGLILGFYSLLALPRMSVALQRVVSAERRAVLAPVGERVRGVFTGYLRARLIVSAAVGSLAILGLWIVGMPFWLILGIIVGVANLVPMLGSAIGGIPVLLVALLAKPPIYLLAALVVLIVAHAVDGYILSPIVLRETTDLHPVVVLIAVLVGGALLGLWGILAAVPVAGALQVMLLEFVRRRRLAADAADAVAT
jgi:predicted PurR-regulated permease PerM